MEEEPGSEPSLWRQIPNTVKIGVGMIAVGCIGEMAAVARSANEIMNVTLANALVTGNQISYSMPDSTRNLALGSAAVIAIGVVPFFNGVHFAEE